MAIAQTLSLRMTANFSLESRRHKLSVLHVTVKWSFGRQHDILKRSLRQNGICGAHKHTCTCYMAVKLEELQIFHLRTDSQSTYNTDGREFIFDALHKTVVSIKMPIQIDLELF